MISCIRLNWTSTLEFLCCSHSLLFSKGNLPIIIFACQEKKDCCASSYDVLSVRRVPQASLVVVRVLTGNHAHLCNSLKINFWCSQSFSFSPVRKEAASQLWIFKTREKDKWISHYIHPVLCSLVETKKWRGEKESFLSRQFGKKKFLVPFFTGDNWLLLWEL